MTSAVASDDLFLGDIAPPSRGLEKNVAQTDSGWRAQIRCNFEKGPRNTFVRRNHVGPLSIQRPFYPEGRTAHVYLLHPPGGVVGGDGLHADISVSENASGLITTPGATKFYRSEGRVARVCQRLRTLGDLEWLPQENIFFNGSMVSLNTDISIESAGTLAFWEIHCFGRLAGDLPFTEGNVITQLSVRRENKLIFHDRFCADGQQSLNRMTGLRGCSVSGMMVLYPLPEESAKEAVAPLLDDPSFALSCIDGLLIVRYVGDSSERAKEGFCKVWSFLRMALSQRCVCVPRIWAT